MEQFLNNLLQWFLTSGLKLVGGVIFVLVAFKIISVVFKKLENKKPKKIHIDDTIRVVGLSVLKNVLRVVVIIVFIMILGFETTGIAAAIASIGLTIGLALEGSLSNIASFVIIVCMRQFRIGDYIECAGVSGTVDKITLFYTVLITAQNQVISVPNSAVSGSICTNYSMKDTRRLDLTFSIAYENNFLKAKKIISECIDRTGLALPEPAPFVNINAHNASSIDIVVRVWTKSSDYWTMNWSLLEMIKMEFDNNDISIPYQQLDVHVVDNKPSKINYNIRDFEIKHVEAEEINSIPEPVVEETPTQVEESTDIIDESVEVVDSTIEIESDESEVFVEPVEEEYVPVKQNVVSGKVTRTKGQRQSSGKIIVDKKKQKAQRKAEKRAMKLAKKQAKLEKKLDHTELDQ